MVTSRMHFAAEQQIYHMDLNDTMTFIQSIFNSIWT